MYKRPTAILFSLSLIFSTSSVYAVDPVGESDWAWQRSLNDDIKKSTVTVEAARTYPVTVSNANGTTSATTKTQLSSTKVAASASSVGSKLIRGFGGDLLATPVNEILG
jgi:hypothetical protein